MAQPGPNSGRVGLAHRVGLILPPLAKVNNIHKEGKHEETKPIDDPISFPLVNSNRVIVPHYDALVLTLCIHSFDVHKVLVDPSSATDLLQLPAFKQMKLSLGVVNSAG